jgi:hypothetical protein
MPADPAIHPFASFALRGSLLSLSVLIAGVGCRTRDADRNDAVQARSGAIPREPIAGAQRPLANPSAPADEPEARAVEPASVEVSAVAHAAPNPVFAGARRDAPNSAPATRDTAKAEGRRRAGTPASTKGDDSSRATLVPDPDDERATLAAVPRVRRLVVTRAIDRREPAKGELRAGDEPLFAFVELASGSDQEHKIVVTFERDGEGPVGNVRLTIPAHDGRWRTWGMTRRVHESGSWTAVVRTEDGRELARRSFNLKPAR